jgi:hypothetical protein
MLLSVGHKERQRKQGLPQSNPELLIIVSTRIESLPLLYERNSASNIG